MLHLPKNLSNVREKFSIIVHFIVVISFLYNGNYCLFVGATFSKNTLLTSSYKHFNLSLILMVYDSTNESI